MAHILQNEFEKLNWVPISNRTNQHVLSTIIKFVNDVGPNYFNEVLQWATESSRNLRNYYPKLKQLFPKTATSQKSLSLLEP